MSDRVEIFDTTLRDGEQSPGASMDDGQKIKVALQLEKLGVDVIEAGFPIASENEFESVKKVAALIKGPRVAALARAIRPDIERAAAALEQAAKPVLHTFIATSQIHMEHKLKLEPDQVVDDAAGAVRLAKSLIPRVEFSAEDATRSDWDFLVRVSQAAIDEGADVINLPDTVGYTTPLEMYEMFRHVIGNVKNADHVIFSTHNHNDLGLAVANALAAVRGGARQVECCLNGIGERAGNTPLEEVVMAIRTRQDVHPYEVGIKIEEITNSSKLLSSLTGLVIPYNKPIIGRNAFAHEAGIHQHGMIANKSTYEIMTPESVGRNQTEFVLGKHSGRAGLAKRCEELGFTLGTDEVAQLYERFITLADKKKEIFDDDLRILVLSMRDETFAVYNLLQLDTSGKDPTMALVKLGKGDAGDEELTATATGDGPVHAACMAIEQIVGEIGRLEEFTIRAITPGKDAMGEAHVVVRFAKRDFVGNGASTDIIEAAVKAYLNALNKYLALKGS
ncbi:MAG: 2-isopropylmalate synthase [Candidatus Hydrogenedentes bacterium]|nr:2-isopropylmalate synthase [Candidatus Hydrogenedentota bacterium]